MTFWALIVESNTFNFAILLLIFAVIYKKLNVSNIIENLKQNIIQTVENAKLEKETAKKNLSDAKKIFSTVENEVKENLADAHNRAQKEAQSIIENTNTYIEQLKANTQKAISTEEKKISSQLTNQALQKSIELAREKIIKTLKDNPELHSRYIEESIGEI